VPLILCAKTIDTQCAHLVCASPAWAAKSPAAAPESPAAAPESPVAAPESPVAAPESPVAAPEAAPDLDGLLTETHATAISRNPEQNRQSGEPALRCVCIAL
jgi:hypothetical protein